MHLNPNSPRAQHGKKPLLLVDRIAFRAFAIIITVIPILNPFPDITCQVVNPVKVDEIIDDDPVALFVGADMADGLAVGDDHEVVGCGPAPGAANKPKAASTSTRASRPILIMHPTSAQRIQSEEKMSRRPKTAHDPPQAPA